MRKVVVIGAGAAGMMAAISAAEHGAHTVVLEHKDRVGKKILSTGNGRCNFTNLVQTPQCYRSDDPKFPWRVITQFDEKKTVEFFQNIGVYAKNRNGYLYPNSDQAGAVLDSLRMEMERLCVEVHTETEVLEIIPKKNRFVIRTGNGNVTADRVILAAGSKAAPVTGSDGSGYAIAKKWDTGLSRYFRRWYSLNARENSFRVSPECAYRDVYLYMWMGTVFVGIPEKFS